MERIPQELVDKFIDELENDNHGLCVCSLISRRWVDRSRRHLFQRIGFPALRVFARYCALFPAEHGVHSYVRGVTITQPCQRPWVNRQTLLFGLEHINAFRKLESLTLIGITNGSMAGSDTMKALADAFETIAPSIKTMRLFRWRVSPTALVEFICRFPSLDNLAIGDMDYLVGLPGWKYPSAFPPFAGYFEFTDGNGRGPAEKFLRLLSRLPLRFREVSIDVGFSGTPDPLIAILEKCSPVLVKASLYYFYETGMTMVSLLTLLVLRKYSTTLTDILGTAIREINASFPELRELTLKPDPDHAGVVDELVLKLLSVISSPHLSRVTLDHTAPYDFGQADAEKWHAADRTMFELVQRTGRKVSFTLYFSYCPSYIEPIILPHMARMGDSGTLRILESFGE